MERRGEFAAASLQTESYLEREHNARWTVLGVGYATRGITAKVLTLLLPPPKNSCARPAQSLPTSCAAPSSLQKLLAGKGAGTTCWVISENSELAGQEIDLQTALEKTIGYQMGTFISCIPGKLAYFEDEDGRYILER